MRPVHHARNTQSAPSRSRVRVVAGHDVICIVLAPHLIGQPSACLLSASGRLQVRCRHLAAALIALHLVSDLYLIEADPDTFFVTAHCKGHALVLVRPEKLDIEWVKANLIRVWRIQAPKRALKAYDLAQQCTNKTNREPLK
jgi:hypothetical protein